MRSQIRRWLKIALFALLIISVLVFTLSGSQEFQVRDEEPSKSAPAAVHTEQYVRSAKKRIPGRTSPSSPPSPTTVTSTSENSPTSTRLPLRNFSQVSSVKSPDVHRYPSPPTSTANQSTIELFQIPMVPRTGLGNTLLREETTDDTQPLVYQEDSHLSRSIFSGLLRCAVLISQLPENVTMQHRNESPVSPLQCESLSLPPSEVPIRIPPLWSNDDQNIEQSENHNSSTMQPSRKDNLCRSWDCAIREDCMANVEGYCYKSKESLNVHPSHPILKFDLDLRDKEDCHFRQPRGGGLHEELACAWAPDPDKPPPIPDPTSREDGSGTTDSRLEAERTLQAFKNFTANSFQKWYDWGKPEEIVEMKTQEEREQFVVEGSHVEEKENVYMLKNICLRPTGALAGYNSSLKTRLTGSPIDPNRPPSPYNIGPYEGGDDVRSIQFYKESFIREPTNDFFSNVEQLSEPPKFYLNRRLAFMPLTSRANNPGHAVQRLGGLLANIEIAFGSEAQSHGEDNSHCSLKSTIKTRTTKSPLTMADIARHDVTTVYAFIENPEGLAKFYNYCSPNCTFQDFAFKQYTTLATTSHFHIWNNASQAAAHLPWAHPSNFKNNNKDKDSAGGFTPNNTMVCFKEAVVYQACHHHDCLDLRNGKDVPRHAFGMYYSRSAAVQQHLARRLRRCSGMSRRAARKKPNADNPVVLYAFRDRSRGLSMGAYQVEQMLRVVKTNLNGSLVLSDMSRLTTWEMVRLYSRADILIGPYGAGLYFLFMMPPGSVTIELNTGAFRQSRITGIDQNPWSDYGGMTRASGSHHSVITFSGAVGRYPKGWIHVSPQIIQQQLVRALCILKQRRYLERICGGANPKAENLAFQRVLMNDPQGQEVRRVIRGLQSPSFYFPRPSLVHTWYALSHYLGPVMMPQRLLVNRAMLVALGDCGPKDYQYFYHFFMNYQSMSANIYWVIGSDPDKQEKRVGGNSSALDLITNRTLTAGEKDEDDKEGTGNADDFNEAKGGGKTISSAVNIPPFKTHKDIVNDILYGDRMRRFKYHLCDPALTLSDAKGSCGVGPFLTVVVTKKYLRSEGFARYLSRNTGGFTRSKFLQALHNEAKEPLSQTELNRLHEEGELNYDYALLVRELPLKKDEGSNAKVLILDDES